MKSGIFAVVNVGHLRLYIGEMHNFKKRWAPLLQQLNSGRCKHTGLQAEWDKYQGQRNVTFHIAADLEKETTLLGYKHFMKDLKSQQTSI